jgi:chromosome segregation ATPase
VLEINVSSLKPSTAPPLIAPSSSYPTDAHTSIDLLTHRLKTLEYRIGDLEADDVDEYHQTPTKQSRKQRPHSSSSSRSPSRRSARFPSDEGSHSEATRHHQITVEFISETLKELLQKIQKYKQNSNEMAETMRSQYRDLNQHITELKFENRQIKEIVSKFENEQKTDRKAVEILTKKQQKSNQDRDEIRSERRIAEGEVGPGNEQIKILQTKIKLLSQNTSKVCKSLSVGISDSQYSILLIFSWAEQVHSAFEILANELEIDGTICPRLQLQNHKGTKQHSHHNRQQQQLLEDDDDHMVNIPTYFQQGNIESTFGLGASDEEMG